MGGGGRCFNLISLPVLARTRASTTRNGNTGMRVGTENNADYAPLYVNHKIGNFGALPSTHGKTPELTEDGTLRPLRVCLSRASIRGCPAAGQADSVPRSCRIHQLFFFSRQPPVRPKSNCGCIACKNWPHTLRSLSVTMDNGP